MRDSVDHYRELLRKTTLNLLVCALQIPFLACESVTCGSVGSPILGTNAVALHVMYIQPPMQASAHACMQVNHLFPSLMPRIAIQ